MHYSTGKSRHLGYKGKPIDGLDSATAAILINKGVIVESLEELFETIPDVKENAMQHPDVIDDVVIKVDEKQKKERKPRTPKQVKPKRVAKRVSKK